MAAGINIDNLAAAIAKGLEEYSEEVTQAIKKAVDDTAKEAADELKQKSPKRTGAYGKDWTSKKAYEDSRSKRATVYNKKRYRLTHLLEYGHALRGGGRVDPRPHIKEIEEKAIKDFEARIKEGI